MWEKKIAVTIYGDWNPNRNFEAKYGWPGAANGSGARSSVNKKGLFYPHTPIDTFFDIFGPNFGARQKIPVLVTEFPRKMLCMEQSSILPLRVTAPPRPASLELLL